MTKRQCMSCENCLYERTNTGGMYGFEEWCIIASENFMTEHYCFKYSKRFDLK